MRRLRVESVTLDKREKINVSYSKGYCIQDVQRVNVIVTNRGLFDAAVETIKKERRRRRAGGGAFEFRVTLREE